MKTQSGRSHSGCVRETRPDPLLGSRKGPLLIIGTVVGPELDERTVRRGCSGHIERLGAGVNRRDPVIAAADRGEKPLLVVATTVGPELYFCAVGGRAAVHVERLAARHADDAVLVAAAVQQRPALVVTPAVAPLDNLRAVSRPGALRVERATAVPIHDLERAIAGRRTATTATAAIENRGRLRGIVDAIRIVEHVVAPRICRIVPVRREIEPGVGGVIAFRRPGEVAVAVLARVLHE